MSLIDNIKDFVQKVFSWSNKAEEEFGIKLNTNAMTNDYVQRCINAYLGKPHWLKSGISTINMAKTICTEIARLTTMNIDISVKGGARAEYLQREIDKIRPELRQWVEYACAAGEMIIKPNGNSVDVLFPGQYIITQEMGKCITGIVFIDDYFNATENKYYTRLEYHRIEDGVYRISNRCFISDKPRQFTKKIPIEDTAWEGISEETIVTGVSNMLFGRMRIPGGNNVEFGSKSGLPVFSDALQELQDLDFAYSLNAKEIHSSNRTVIIDSDRLMAGGINLKTGNRQDKIAEIGLPDFVKAVEGSSSKDDYYHEINPSLNTEERVLGINHYLDLIGFKCGFSNGYFVFNEKTGMLTATQVESDDRRTIETITDMRHALTTCIDELLYALDKFADAYNFAAKGSYKVIYDMDDLTQNNQEDMERWYRYAHEGKVPFWLLLVKFDGYSEEEAKEIVRIANEERLANLRAEAEIEQQKTTE